MLKRRRPDKPAAVMFFALDLALAALPELGPRTARALDALLPGARDAALPNPAHRFPLACGPEPTSSACACPAWPPAAGRAGRRPLARAAVQRQRRAAAPTPAASRTCPSAMRDDADLVLDGGELPGTPSTVVDLRAYEGDGEWSVVREGASSSVTEVAAKLESAP